MSSKTRRSKSENGKIGRRAFLSTLGGASAAAMLPEHSAVAAANAKVMAGGAGSPAQAEPQPAHQRVRQSCPGYSGIPLGGIGAGSIEIKPDGTFRDWLIFNMGAWSPRLPPGQTVWPDPKITDHSLAFFVWAKPQGGSPVCRRLDVEGQQQDLYSLSWAQCVDAIEFAGEFPRAQLHYVDETLPVKVRSDFFSPFIPHEARISGTPGFHGVFTVSNPGKRPVACSLLATLHNPLASGAPNNAARKLSNKVLVKGQTCSLVMGTTARLLERETLGSLALSITGGRPSYIAEDFGRYLGEGMWIHGGPFFEARFHSFQLPFRRGATFQSFLIPFRQSGRLPSLPPAGCPAKLLQLNDEEISALTRQQAADLISAIGKTPSLKWYLDLAERVDPQYVHGKLVKTTLRELRDVLNQYAGKDRAALDFGDAALCTSVQLEPGETVEIPVAFSWYFPYHISGHGVELGHQYERWFSDASEANDFLVANAAEHRRRVATFAGALATSDLPEPTRFSWSAQLSTLIKSTWWQRDGAFGVWEGLGCCGLRTLDVAYQGSPSTLALFPELQQNLMEIIARDLPNVPVPRGRNDARQIYFVRGDIRPQFIMIVCRDYLWTGDKKYLARMWPHVLSALAYMASLDEDGDGLPEHDVGWTTYDQWALHGTPSYIGSLYLGAYTAARRMAADINDAATRRKMTDLLKRAKAGFDKKLWNGSYYNLWFNGGVSDPCCMTDQLSGIWFSSLAGLQPALPAKRVRRVLAKIFQENFDPDQGLVNSSYPPGTTPHFPAYMNVQATANWTGIEYASASFFLEYGMREEAFAIVEAVNRRYARAGRWWNQLECGDHYYRAMASWCSLVAAGGFKPDQSSGRLQIAPPVAPVRAPWISAQAFGTLDYSGKTLAVICLDGELEIRTLVTPIRTPKVRLNHRPLPSHAAAEAGLWRIHFDQPLTLRPQSRLTVTG